MTTSTTWPRRQRNSSCRGWGFQRRHRRRSEFSLMVFWQDLFWISLSTFLSEFCSSFCLSMSRQTLNNVYVCRLNFKLKIMLLMIILCHPMLPTYTSSKTCVILKVQLKWLLLKFPLLYLLFSYACSLSFSPSLFIFTNFNLTLFLSGFSLFSFLSHSMSLYMCSVFMSHTHSLTHSSFLSFLHWIPKHFSMNVLIGMQSSTSQTATKFSRRQRNSSKQLLKLFITLVHF